MQLALIKFRISADVDVIADRDSGRGIIVLTADSRVVLKDRVLANADLGRVSAESRPVPGRRAFTHRNVADKHSVRRDPVSI